MVNRVLVGKKWFDMTPDYVEGAFIERTALSAPKGQAETEAWKDGVRNEQNRQHVRFGIDLLTAPDEGVSFGLDEKRADGFRGRGYHEDAEEYHHELLRVTGAFAAIREIAAEEGRMTPGATRQALLARGIRVATWHTDILWSRMHYENKRVGEPLTDVEAGIVDALKEPRKRLMLALGRVSDRHWEKSVVSKYVAYEARRSEGWVSATTRKMVEAGEGFLVNHSVNGYIFITKKGWTAYDRLVAAEAKAKAEAAVVAVEDAASDVCEETSGPRM